MAVAHDDGMPPSTNVALRTSRLLLALAALTTGVSARADGGVQDKALAETLFDQAVALLKQGSVAEACPKLAESQRLDPAPGTLLYLGDCYERVGKLSTAWATFREASALARAAGQPTREELAKKRAAMLEKDLPFVLVSVGVRTPSLEVRLDDSAVREALWESEVPVDPGTHELVASAPGRVTWTAKLTVSKGEHARVVIPELASASSPEPAPPVAPPTQPPPDHVAAPPAPRASWQRPAALAAGGLGIVGLGVGTFFGLRAFSKWGDAEPQCPNDRCTHEGKQLADSATSASQISTVAFVAGGVLLAGGAALFFTAPKTTRVGVAFRPTSAAVEGSF